MTTPSPLPRMHMVTLGVADLPRAKAFYRDVFGTDPIGPEGVAFFCLPGVWLGLYPREHLAADIGPEVPTARAPFSGVTIACNAESRAEVDATLRAAVRWTTEPNIQASVSTAILRYYPGADLFAQSVWLDPTQNAFGAITSNGLRSHLGTF